MKTRVGFKRVHDNSPEVIVMEGRIPLNRVAEVLHARFAQEVHSTAVKVAIAGTGPRAGEVLITLGPFSIEGIVVYEGPRPPTESDMGAS